MNSPLLDDAEAITKGMRAMRSVCLGVPRTRAIRERLDARRRARNYAAQADHAANACARTHEALMAAGAVCVGGDTYILDEPQTRPLDPDTERRVREWFEQSGPVLTSYRK